MKTVNWIAGTPYMPIARIETSIILVSMRSLVTTLAFLTILISCSISDDLDSFKLEDIKTYNQKIDDWKVKGESWIEDPLLIGRELFRLDDPERNTTIHFERKAENKATITLTQEGLSDDSVDGVMRIIEFEKTNGSWAIKQIRIGFKCWEDRGHTNYSGDTCS